MIAAIALFVAVAALVVSGLSYRKYSVLETMLQRQASAVGARPVTTVSAEPVRRVMQLEIDAYRAAASQEEQADDTDDEAVVVPIRAPIVPAADAVVAPEPDVPVNRKPVEFESPADLTWALAVTGVWDGDLTVEHDGQPIEPVDGKYRIPAIAGTNMIDLVSPHSLAHARTSMEVC